MTIQDIKRKVREFVKKECDELNWKYHIIPVVRYAKLLAKKLNVDEELAELGALLHDIGRIKFDGKNHEITGIQEAEKILKKLGASQNIIDEMKHCVESHRGAVKPRTIIAKIVASADAMAHFDVIPVLIQVGLRKKITILKKHSSGFTKKLRETGIKKLTIPEAKEIVKEKYKAIKLLFDSMRRYM